MRQTEALLERINAMHDTSFRLRGRYAQGENQGAYAVEDALGRPFVLKWQPQPDMLSRLKRAGTVADRLVALGVPAPRYYLIDTFQDGTTYWLQTALRGDPPAPLRLSLEHVHQLLELNERQAGQALSPEQDWSWYVRAVVFEGESGWTETLRQHSPATRALLTRLERVTTKKESSVTRTTDLVHGDLAIGNVLVIGDMVTGIVDWDAAGCGDRALDLSKLLFYSYEYDNEPVRALLWERIATISGHDALVVFLVYNILAQLDWDIRHHGQAAVDARVAMSELILADMRRLLGSFKVQL